SKALPTYQQRLQEDVAVLVQLLDRFGIAVPAQSFKDSFDPGAVMGLAAKLLTSLSGVLTNAFFIFLTATFILLEAGSFPVKLRSLLADPDVSMGQFDKLAENLKRYVAMKTVISLLTGVAVTIWLMILGVDYPILWGLLAFLFNYVPNIGSIIAAIPAIMLAFVQGGGSLALATLIGYAVINIVTGNVIEPKIMGRGLGLSSLVVFLSLVFWGWVLGPVGMLLSVPLTIVVKIALESYDQTHWIAVLMGPESEIDQPPPPH
ncbi:MAG: transport protein, partial [Halothiobacillaceae bacterium]